MPSEEAKLPKQAAGQPGGPPTADANGSHVRHGGMVGAPVGNGARVARVWSGMESQGEERASGLTNGHGRSGASRWTTAGVAVAAKGAFASSSSFGSSGGVGVAGVEEEDAARLIFFERLFYLIDKSSAGWVSLETVSLFLSFAALHLSAAERSAVLARADQHGDRRFVRAEFIEVCIDLRNAWNAWNAWNAQNARERTYCM